MKITRKEYENITTEIAERLKDLIYDRAENLVREQLTKAEIETWLDSSVTDVIQINYEVKMVVGDLIQMLGRQRRLKPQ